MEYTKKIQDLFILHSDEQIVEDWLSIIIDLYQPFLGSEAITTYLTLKQLQELKHAKTHHFLMKYTRLDFPVLQAALTMLEASALVSTYTAQIEGVDLLLYQVHSPMSRKQFFVEPMFCKMLINYVGEEHFTQLYDQQLDRELVVESLEHVQNVSKQFKTIFAKELKEGLNNKVPEVKQELNIKKVPRGEDYYFETFLLYLPASLRDHVDFKVEHKIVLKKIADLYELNSEQMAQIFYREHQASQGVLTEAGLRQTAYEYSVALLRNQIAKEKPQSSRSKEGPQLNVAPEIRKWLRQVKKQKATDYLQLLTGQKLTPMDLQIIDMLQLDYRLPDEVINVLLDYVWKTNGGLSKAFVEAIANQWRKKHVTLAEEAYQVLDEFVKNSSKRKKERMRRSAEQLKGRRTEIVPEFGKNETVNTELDEAFAHALKELERR